MVGKCVKRGLEPPVLRGVLVEFVYPARENQAKLSIGIARIDDARPRFGHGSPVGTFRSRRAMVPRSPA